MDKQEDLKSLIERFRENWSTKTRKLSIGNKYSNIKDVYPVACKRAYAPSVLRALKYPENTSNEIKPKELKNKSFDYLADRLEILFERTNFKLFTSEEKNEFSIFEKWEEETVNHIVNLYREKGVTDYTYGNGQKLVNMAIKYVLSSNRVDYNHPVFKYCHIPVDGIIQKIAKKKLGVDLLYQGNKKPKYYSPWSTNDNRENFLDYQERIRTKTQEKGHYSPLIWEIENWENNKD